MKILPRKLLLQRGLTLVELLAAMAISSILFISLFAMYNSMASTQRNVQNITDLQRKLRLSSSLIKRELANAGGGIEKTETFPNISSNFIKFSYRDRLTRNCPNDTDVVTFVYRVRTKSLMKKVLCNGRQIKYSPILSVSNTISLRFDYFDDSQSATSTSEDVSLVQYTISVGEKNSYSFQDESRRTIAKVNIRNHGVD